ncbi:MAG: T9SS type A sorting domain-containing protein [Chryseobacterium sp.]|nr:T9SS type A sorting domain-containing protein [Chryseobacterium sp.]
MNKKLILFCVIFYLSLFKSQNISTGKWSDLFSYNNVLVLREDTDRIIAATENGIFYFTPSTGEIKKLSKANGLHDVKISAFDYNPITKIGLIGYVSGAMDVVTPEGISLVVDIPIATGYSGSKKINHISISGNDAIISAGYGVSIFKLDKKEFADTAFFNDSGVFNAANESVIKDNVVYSATSNGVKSHAMDVSFPIYSSWAKSVEGNFTQISSNDFIYAGTSTEVFKGSGATFSSFKTGFTGIKDIITNNSTVLVADTQNVSRFDPSGTLQKNINIGQNINTALQFKNQIYTGTNLSGIFDESLQPYKPDGPYSNTSYKIDIVGQQIVVSTGGRDAYNLPIIRNLGYYYFDGTQWKYPEFFKSFNGSLNVLDAVINPAKPREIFFTNYTFADGNMGIYRMEDNVFAKQYVSTGTFYNRVGGLTFDENNQLFASATDVSKFGFYYFNSANDTFTQVLVVNGFHVQKPFANSGILYVFSPRTGGGILLYNYNNTPSSLSDDSYKVLRETNNIPSPAVISAALDKDDVLWIGSEKGLRTIQNPKDVISAASPQTENIVIVQNGLPEELFRDSAILQIAVDSGNQKWVSLDGGGIYYLSSDGQKTITHFTKANSPLPTDNVTDIKVDEKSGKVYFVTLDGIVIYQGDVANVTSNFGDVLVYPNPVVYANYKGNVKIRGLAEKTNIRITDAAGNLVHQAVARGGYHEWDLNNQRGKRVASGIYFVLMSNEDGTDTATAKIAVVN